MRRIHLSTLLIVINVGLLLLTVSGVALAALRLVQQFADEQALARVRQAGAIAQKEIANSGDAVLVSAQLLAERPTLRRLIDAGDTESLTEFLGQFQQTSKLDGAAIVSDTQIIASSGTSLAWQVVELSSSTPARGYVFQQPESGPLLLGAHVQLAGSQHQWATVATVLNDTFARRLSDDLGLAVAIVDSRTADLSGAHGTFRQQALAGTEILAGRVDDLQPYLAALPLRTPDGNAVGLVEITLPTSDVTASLRQLAQTLLILAVTVTMFAATISFLTGRSLSRPLLALTGAAARIGHGDLDTPILRASGAEIGTLSETLEEMRRDLLRLTADLQHQRAEAQAIITGVVEGVFTVDRERRIRYLNPQAATMLGTRPDDALGRFCGDVLRPQGAGGIRPCEEHCPIVHARFRGGARATEHLLLPDDQRRTVVITSAPVAGAAQVQVMRDETELEAMRRLRDGILANISHEFRTPLSAQLASLELLMDQLPDLSTEQIASLLQALQRGTLRLTQLIDNLLESSRIEAGQHALRHQIVALDEVMEDALQLTGPLFNQREQQVILDLPYPLPPVPGDGPRLTQVFVNLLANANKFAPAGSTIHIGGNVEPESVTLWVDDEGPGLPSGAEQALFTRFVRAQTEEPEASGVGLGLWLVKSIIERHNGHIEAGSNGQGTRMSVSLPREQVHENSRRRR